MADADDEQAELSEPVRPGGQDDRAAVVDEDPPELMHATWEELGVVEHADYLLFPDKLTRMLKNGTVDETPVMLRVPRDHEVRKARAWARSQAVDDGLDLDRDADLVQNLQDLHLLALAVRNSSAPYEALVPDPLRLERTYDKPCLTRLWKRVDVISHRLYPGEDELSPEEVVVLIARVAKERNIGPLVDYALAAQSTFVLYMVDRLLNLERARLSEELSDSSTPASSPPSK